MTTSTTTRTADEWAADIAARLSATEPGWTSQPSAQHEPRCVAYLIGPHEDERIRLELPHSAEFGTPSGRLWADIDFGHLAHYARPNAPIGTSIRATDDEADGLVTALRTEIIPTMRELLPACHAGRDQDAAREAQCATILAEFGERLELDPAELMDTPVYFGRPDGHIVGKVDAFPNRVTVSVMLTVPEALALADYIAERRRSIGDVPAPDHYDGPDPF